MKSNKKNNKANLKNVSLKPLPTTFPYTVGRPRKFKTPQALQKKIVEFFNKCAEFKTVPTVTGLAYFLDTNRQTLLDYQSEFFTGNPAFTDTIKKAKQLIEYHAEQMLYDKINPAGVIFGLKNNYNWKDKVEHEIIGSQEEKIKPEELQALKVLTRMFAQKIIKVGVNNKDTIDIKPKNVKQLPP